MPKIGEDGRVVPPKPREEQHDDVDLATAFKHGMPILLMLLAAIGLPILTIGLGSTLDVPDTQGQLLILGPLGVACLLSWLLLFRQWKKSVRTMGRHGAMRYWLTCLVVAVAFLMLSVVARMIRGR